MSEVATEQRRGRGRPQVRSDEETRRIIAEAARDVFVASGYSAASVDDVARAAGVSKKTLYRLFPAKADLFTASITDRIDGFILGLDEEGLAKLPTEAGLVHLLTEYGLLTLSADTTAIQKLVVAESDRFPELAAAFYRDAVAATQVVLVRCLERLCREGAIELEDADEAVGMLRGMMTFEPLRAATLGQKPLPCRDAIGTRAARCARLFLDGCRARGSATARDPGHPVATGQDCAKRGARRH